MQPYTHQIISITAAKTKYSDRMWKCATRDGCSVAIFTENNGRPGTLHLFREYGAELQALTESECLRWTEHPIEVVLRPDGKYLQVVAVASRPLDAVPDVPFVPDSGLSAQAAVQWARNVLASDAVVWDTETTGTDRLFDEVVSIGIVQVDGTVLLDQVIRPLNLERNAESGAETVNQLSPEQLASAPGFAEVYPDIKGVLQGKPWVTYNAAFDTVILERDCLRHGLEPVVSSGVTCAMEWYARFHGEWDAGWQSYRAKKLLEAAQALGVEVETAHHALADARMTLGVMHRMADDLPF